MNKTSNLKQKNDDEQLKDSSVNEQMVLENTEDKQPEVDLKNLGQSLRSLLFFFLLLFLIPQIENWIGQDNIRNFINSGGIFAPIIFVFVRIVTVVISPLKLGPLSIILHRVFGFWPSVFYAIITVVVGSSINLLISRKWGNKIIGFFFGPDILKIVDKYSQKYLNRNFFTDFLLFLSNYELVSYASGLTDMKFKRVVLVSGLSSLITAPILVMRDLSIGVNDFNATMLFVFAYIISTAPILYIAWGDISTWWSGEMQKIKTKSSG